MFLSGNPGVSLTSPCSPSQLSQHYRMVDEEGHCDHMVHMPEEKQNSYLF